MLRDSKWIPIRILSMLYTFQTCEHDTLRTQNMQYMPIIYLHVTPVSCSYVTISTCIPYTCVVKHTFHTSAHYYFHNHILYSRKYWRELKLIWRLGPKWPLQRCWRILIWWFSTGSRYIYMWVSLVPRRSEGRGERTPGTHCLRMHLIYLRFIA